MSFSNQNLKIYYCDLFQEVQRKNKLSEPIASYLIKPVQRVTKYNLLLKDLLSCCEEHTGEIRVHNSISFYYLVVYAEKFYYL